MSGALVIAADATGIARAADAITTGAVVGYLTDTVYALAVDPFNIEALNRLVAIKGRSAMKPSPLIAADLAQIERLAETNELARRLAASFWPGPLTLVLKGRVQLSRAVMNEAGGIGMRVPAHDSARSLAAACGLAITATSANPTGEEPLSTAAAVATALAVDLVLDDGPASGSVPSTVLDVSEARPVLLREGAIASDALVGVLGDVPEAVAASGRGA